NVAGPLSYLQFRFRRAPDSNDSLVLPHPKTFTITIIMAPSGSDGHASSASCPCSPLSPAPAPQHSPPPRALSWPLQQQTNMRTRRRQYSSSPSPAPAERGSEDERSDSTYDPAADASSSAHSSEDGAWSTTSSGMSCKYQFQKQLLMAIDRRRRQMYIDEWVLDAESATSSSSDDTTSTERPPRRNPSWASLDEWPSFAVAMILCLMAALWCSWACRRCRNTASTATTATATSTATPATISTVTTTTTEIVAFTPPLPDFTPGDFQWLHPSPWAVFFPSAASAAPTGRATFENPKKCRAALRSRARDLKRMWHPDELPRARHRATDMFAAWQRDVVYKKIGDLADAAMVDCGEEDEEKEGGAEQGQEQGGDEQNEDDAIDDINARIFRKAAARAHHMRENEGNYAEARAFEGVGEKLKQSMEQKERNKKEETVRREWRKTTVETEEEEKWQEDKMPREKEQAEKRSWRNIFISW
ncbi:hypothetical protein IWX49DRAFT_643290, partial [Phyllosticta citricarpa]